MHHPGRDIETQKEPYNKSLGNIPQLIMAGTYNQVVPLTLGKKKKKPQAANTPVSNSGSAGNNVVNPYISTSSQPYKKMKSMSPVSTMYQPLNTSNKWGLDSMGGSEAAERRRKRAERFSSSPATSQGNSRTGSNSAARTPKNTFDPMSEMEDYTNLNAIASKSQAYDKDKHIIGTCQTIEKSYLRLTSEPNPELVRPLNVLKAAYAKLMERHKKKEVTYTYLCDQFKAIRQDLRVQMIETKFTVSVYETHAKLALESGDLGEYNQCQSRLLILYEKPALKSPNYGEFMSFLILYYMMTEDNAAIMALRLKLLEEDPVTFKKPMVQKSFKLSNARTKNDYHRFMKICNSVRSLGKHLINVFLEKEILKALDIMCRAYNQLSLDFLKEEFNFPDTASMALYLQKKNLGSYIVTKDEGSEKEFKYLDSRACRQAVANLYQGSRKIDIKGQK